MANKPIGCKSKYWPWQLKKIQACYRERKKENQETVTGGMLGDLSPNHEVPGDAATGPNYTLYIIAFVLVAIVIFALLKMKKSGA